MARQVLEVLGDDVPYGEMARVRAQQVHQDRRVAAHAFCEEANGEDARMACEQ